MAWILVSRRNRRHAATWAAAGVLALLTGALGGGVAVGPGALFWVCAGFVSFALCARCALTLWRADEMVFNHRLRSPGSRPIAPPEIAVSPFRFAPPDGLKERRHV